MSVQPGFWRNVNRRVRGVPISVLALRTLGRIAVVSTNVMSTSDADFHGAT